jgi:hypothetical protein
MAKRKKKKYHIDSKRSSDTNPTKKLEWLRWFISKPEVKIAIIYFWNLETKKYQLLLFRPEMTTFKKLEEKKSHINHIF